MLFRRSTAKTPQGYCQTCARIRAFLAVAGMLIVALPFFGDKAAPLSKLTPMGIALTMVGIGCIAFIARWIAWRRSEAQTQQSADHSPDGQA